MFFFVTILNTCDWLTQGKRVRMDVTVFLGHSCFLETSFLHVGKVLVPTQSLQCLSHRCNTFTSYTSTASVSQLPIIVSSLQFCAPGTLRTLNLNAKARNSSHAYCMKLICSCKCPLSHQTLPWKQKFKDKVIKNFKMETLEC